jgi:hypothetical protein
MKFWLIVFLFSADGDYLDKGEYQIESQEQCVELSGLVAQRLVNTSYQVQLYCVTDDHYNGRSIDDGIPLD